MARAKKSKVEKISKPKIFIIDRKRGKLARLKDELSEKGIMVKVLDDKLEGFEQDIRERWDGILLRAELSKLIPRIRKLLGVRYLPIMLVYYDKKPKKDASPLNGADDYIVLPEQQKELLTRIYAMIERRQKTIDDHTVMLGYQTLEHILSMARQQKDDFQVLRSAVIEVEKLFPGSKCSVIMLDQKRARAVVLADATSEKELDIPLDLKRYPEIRRVVKTKKPLAISDVQKHPLMREVRKILAGKSIYSLLAVPIFYQDELIGILMIRAVERPHIYFPVEIYFSQLIAETLAMALKNIRLAKLAEEEAKEKKEMVARMRARSKISRKLERIFEHASDGLILVNQRGEITGVNQNFLRLTGFERKEVVGKRLEEILEFEEAKDERVVDWVKRKRRAGSSNLLLKTKGEKKKFITVHIEHLPGVRGEILISIHDVTEERRLSLELRRTKEFLENLIQSSMEAIIAADMNGTIILFNRAAEELTGYKAEEVIGKKNIVDLYAPGGARAVMKKLRSPFYGGVGRLETTHNVLIGKNGEEIPINMTASIIYDDQGREIATVGLYQDLRERVEIEKKLRQAQERLFESQRRQVMMALAGATAHELNQPLTSILGYAQILGKIKEKLEQKLKRDPVLKTFKNGISTIQEQAERMAEVIKKLGELTEFETTDYAGRQKIIDLKSVGKKERLMEEAAEHIEEAILIINREMMVLNALGALEKIFGENPLGKNLSRYLDGINYTQLSNALNQLPSDGSTQIELQIKSARGESKTVEIFAEAVEDKNLALVIRDISEARALEKELAQLFSFQKQILTSLPIPIAILDSDGRISLISKEAERLFGYSLEEIQGKFPENIFKNFNLAEYNQQLRQAREQGSLEGRLFIRSKAGEIINVYHFTRVMKNDKGEVIGYISYLQDLSEKRLLEKAVQDKTDFLEIITTKRYF